MVEQFIPLTTFIAMQVAVLAVEIVIALLVLWKDIAAFFNPSGWAWITIKTKSLDTLSFLVSKGLTETFIYNKKPYNLFYPNKEIPHIRHGRVVAFFYEIDDPFPKDMNKFVTTATDNEKEKITHDEFATLWVDDDDFIGFLIKNLIPILAILGLVIVVIIAITSKGSG